MFGSGAQTGSMKTIMMIVPNGTPKVLIQVGIVSGVAVAGTMPLRMRVRLLEIGVGRILASATSDLGW